MKTLFMFAPIILFMLPMPVKAQPALTTDTILIQATPKEKHIFKSIEIVHYKQRAHLQFAVRKVQNVSTYRVEAGNDSASLMIIGNVIPRCNTVMPSAFAYPLMGDLAQYRYYRVVQVGMGQDWVLSPLLNQFPDNNFTHQYDNGNKSDSLDTIVSSLKR